MDQIQPRNSDLWDRAHTLGTAAINPMVPASGGGHLLYADTLVSKRQWGRLIQDLQVGDKVQTKDNGAQDILWIGSRRMTVRGLFAMPHLRPVRIKSGALGVERPDEGIVGVA
ncbi:Hypothetical protein FKW44_016294 [Caligus rogercresseyi]|uniref:Hedgehog/Intein (Hint) domain-containing protein n=1 Tax=Caligus rogercresseyi TaxID=217165 RepID=A0A7T8H1J3_CALRO|nr:Hypothetical protein FKW44_016294 [Caligus rogercresseyi]